MNKQEAMKILTDTKHDYEFCWSNDFRTGFFEGIDCSLKTIKQLDEPVKPPEPAPWQPEKPVVPRFVADWLEVCKDNLALSLANSMNNIVMRTNNQPDKTIHWLSKNSETFAKAWLYGYEVKKEKLYTARFKASNGYLNFDKDYKELHCVRISKDIAERCSGCWFTEETLVKYSLLDNPAFEIKEVTE